jgi:hypothetical protein
MREHTVNTRRYTMDVRYTTHREILDTTPEDMHFDFPFLIHTDTHPNNIGTKLLSLHPEAEVVSFAIKPAHFSDVEVYSVRRSA